MRATIAQEYRNYRNHQALRSFDKSAPTYWVAKITGRTYRGFHREFIKPVVDYAKANSKLSRGVYYYWHLDDGVYDAVLGRNYDRQFLRVKDGQWQQCTKDEVVAWLNECLG